MQIEDIVEKVVGFQRTDMLGADWPSQRVDTAGL